MERENLLFYEYQSIFYYDLETNTFQTKCFVFFKYLNAVKTDTTYKVYFRSCASDLCNDSDGKRSATNSDPNFGASENMVIKGRE